MSANLYLGGPLEIACDDEEPVLWIRNRRDWGAVSVPLSPRNIEELLAACAEARKYHAMPVIQQAARDEAERSWRAAVNAAAVLEAINNAASCLSVVGDSAERAALIDARETVAEMFDSHLDLEAAAARLAVERAEFRRERDALAAVGRRVTGAFERLGKTTNVVDQLETHRECEAAILALAAALQGAQ